MDLQNIQEQLNTEFAKSDTRIIFWFDDKGEYEDEVSELQLGDVKLHILDGLNWFYSKYILNEADTESKYLVYFTTEDGEKISFDVPMIANSREDAPEKRTFHEKFTLKSREYKYGDKYYLVLADASDEKNILQQYEFMIDIAFMDDFGRV